MSSDYDIRKLLRAARTTVTTENNANVMKSNGEPRGINKGGGRVPGHLRDRLSGEAENFLWLSWLPCLHWILWLSWLPVVSVALRGSSDFCGSCGLCGFPWLTMALVWLFMAFRSSPWLLWLFVASCCSLLVPVAFCGILRPSRGSCGFSWLTCRYWLIGSCQRVQLRRCDWLCCRFLCYLAPP